MYSKGYTGQEKLALREWEYNEDYLRTHEEKMAKLGTSKFQDISAYDLTMYLRGDLFVLVDCLFGFTFSNPSKDVKRVEAFLMTVIEFIEKWMNVVITLHPSGKIDSFLDNRNDAIYQAGVEVFEMMRNILGINKRTSKFFEKYKIFTSNEKYCKKMIETGLDKLYSVVSKYSVDDSWGLLHKLAPVFVYASPGNLKNKIDAYLTALNQSVADNSTLQNSDKLAEFLENYEKAADFVYSNEEKQNLMKNYKEMLETIDSPKGSIIEHEDVLIPLEDLISPDKNFERKPFKINIQVPSPRVYDRASLKPPKAKPKQLFDSKRLDASEYENLIKLIEEKYNNCLEIITSTIFPKEFNGNHEENLTEYLTETADLQELQILNRLEYLISHKKCIEALKVLRWRKKICKIALMDGWEIADVISKKTVNELSVSSSHLIEANLNTFLMRFDDFVPK